MDDIEEKYIEEKYELGFVKPVTDNINYRKEQGALLEKANEVANGDPLETLKYFVACLSHEGHNVEFEIVLTQPKINHETHIKNMTFAIPIRETSPKDALGYYVSWGDGTITHNINKHCYEKQNHDVEYNIRFFGLGIYGFGIDIENENEFETIQIFTHHVKSVKSFGNLGHNFKSLKGAFQTCVSLVSVPANIPSSVTNISKMFALCSSFNQSVDTFDTSNVDNMAAVFAGCSMFNQPLNSWDVSKVTTFRHMFNVCRLFNQPLDNWDTKSAVDMSYMFYGCREFNQPLNTWDTSNVTAMTQMLYGSSSKL